MSASPSAPVTGYGQIFIARGEDTTWTACTGKYFDDAAEARFFQIGSKIVIMNGVDTLAYLDIATATVTPYVALSTPSAPTLTTDNVGGSGFTVTYRITANSTVGETAASAALAVEVDTDRDLWNPPSNGGTDNVIIAWSAVASAQSYNVYMGTVSGFEYLIASGINALTFTDDGTFAQSTTRLYPTVDSTAGPIVSRGANIGGRAFLIGDANNPYKVWNGGDPGYELDFSPANGGGYSLVNSGGKEIPIVVKSFRDAKGSPQITVLCQGTNGNGKRFTLTPDSISLGSSTLTFYAVTEENGQDGTDSPDAVISYNDSLYYPSRDGFKTTGTKPQLQNVLSTNRISNTIQPDLKNIDNTAMNGAVGLGFEGRLYWALPVSSNSNSEIWVLDLERKGAWMKPWSISCDWMLLYNDNSGNTQHLIMENNRIYSLSYSAFTSDNGITFNTSGQSGQNYFSEDRRMWAQLLAVVIMLADVQGEINWQITGKTDDGELRAIGEPTTFNANADVTPVGWSEVNRYITGWGRNRWSGVNLVPTSSNTGTREIIIDIDEEVQWASYAWGTSKPNCDYTLIDVIYIYTETGIKDLD